MNNINQKSLFIALVGSPNVGKSTLVNSLVGTKVSIVSPKAQTTRNSIKGIYVEDNTQLVFVDTPGMFSPKKPLEKIIVQEAINGIAQSDIIAFIVDVKRGICSNSRQVLNNLKNNPSKKILIINKIDKVSKLELLPMAEKINEEGIFDEIFFVSALKNDGVADLLKYFVGSAKNGPWMFPEDQVTDAPLRFFAAEITREKLFYNLQQELPYSIAVETEKWEELENGEIKIYQAIYTQKENQKPIILGKQGAMIKRIGESSRRELEKILGTKVHLFLFVKVKEGWIGNPNIITYQ